MRHLLTLHDVSLEQLQTIFALSADLKAKFKEGVREPLLPGRVMALMFEKQSLRTRVSFQAGMAHLGGSSLMLGDDAGFGKRESIADFTRVLSEMVDVIVVRSKKHATVEAVAEHSACSVINGLTDYSHPCQALADLFTIWEQLGSLDGAKLTWVGDANNVARSLAIACGKLGVDFSVASPQEYAFNGEEAEQLNGYFTESKFTCTTDPQAAVEGASAVYTDVWASMGQEGEQEQRRKDFADFQVNSKLMASAPAEAVFMHCLPAKRGEEVTDEVMDGPQSVIVEQAANRMHVQKGTLAWLLGGAK
ncbi:ornithine carbamoyltransferase [Adhaeretor mobilis]|uniref:Ornithine carbamoyltransferase n=1 Tax=Adhaeretor mobilis TaxID=1930276 RepID=A0A517MSW0_9BACT|nr:ornithine carbamoyltransferase [Adhaeretor mobilis]QDS97975.1 Ornithine carbamoyltransferase [Adhaeretor mobilis]